MKKNSILVCTVLLCSLFATTLSAQTSLTKLATAGVFETDVDKFTSVTDTLTYKSIFGILGLNNSVLSFTGYQPLFQGGLGFKLSDKAYLNTFYEGAFSGGTSGSDLEQATTTYILDVNSNIVGKTVAKASNPAELQDNSQNNVKILLGLGGMGISIGVTQVAQVIHDKFTPDIPGFGTASPAWIALPSVSAFNVTTTDAETTIYNAAGTELSQNKTAYTDGVITDTLVKPYVGWGMELALGTGATLKPSVNFGLNFVADSRGQTSESYARTIGTGIPSYNGIGDVTSYTKKQYDSSANNTEIDTTLSVVLELLGTGSEAGTAEFGLAYNLMAPIYSNTYMNDSGTEIIFAGRTYNFQETTYGYSSTGSSEADTTAWQTDEFTESNHVITPTFSYTATVSPALAMGFSVELPISIGATKSTTTGKLVKTSTYTDASDSLLNYTNVTTKTHTGEVVETQSLNILPTISGALQFDIIPKSLKLNLGAAFSMPLHSSFSSITTDPGIDTRTEVQTYTNTGVVSTNTVATTLGTARSESSLVSFDYAAFDPTATFGLSLTLAEGVVLDSAFIIANALGGPRSTLSPLFFVVQLSIIK